MISHCASVILLVCIACYQPAADNPRTGSLTDHVATILDRQFDGERAMQSVKFFTQYWRIAGGPGFDTCVSYVESTLRPLTTNSSRTEAHGYYEILQDPKQSKTWVPEDGILSIVSPEVRVLHSYAETPVTLCQNSFPHDVTAPLAYVPGRAGDDQYEQADVKGKLVLCDVPAASAYALAMNHGAIGVISSYVPAYNKPEEHPDIVAESGIRYDEERQPFAFNISPRTAEELKKLLGRQKVVLHAQVKSSFVEKPLKTIVAEIPGAIQPDERVVLVAHLDHYKPGANDNASGSATLLEMFRSLTSAIRDRALPRPARTLTFLWVDEYRGTSLWMKRNANKLNRVLAAFVLDMVGGNPEKTGGTFRVERTPDPGAVWFRPPDQHSGWGAGSVDKTSLFGSFLNDYYLSVVQQRSAQTGWKTANNVWEGGSDHDPFLWKKIPAVLSWHFPDFAYHTSMDVVGNISSEEMKNAGVSIATAAYQLAVGDEEVTRSIIQCVTSSWKMRIEVLKRQTAAELDKARPQGGPVLEAAKRQETEILGAWAAWYDEALQSILRVPPQMPSQALNAEIQLEREKLRKSFSDINAGFGF